MMFVQRLDFADTSRLKEELVQCLWWKPVGRSGGRVGKLTQSIGECIMERRASREANFKYYSAVLARARTQGEKWMAAFVLFP